MNKHKVEIYSPRLVGDRFQEHTLPLELLEDLSTLQAMTTEMAKWLYLQKNQGRQRIPKNFTHGISFELQNIEPGSTIPKIVLVASFAGLFPAENVNFFEEAKERIIQAVQAAEVDGNINDYAPDSVLSYFNKFGKNLRNDEYIEFRPEENQKAVFNKESRRRLILASSTSNEFTENVNLRGYISEMDQTKKSFHIELVNGQRILSDYDDTFKETLMESFMNYNQKQKVLLSGTGRFSKTNKLLGLKEVQEIVQLEELDVPFRLEELSVLKDGWLDGHGIAPDKSGLDWLAEMFELFYDPGLPLPHVFPTPDGGVQVEWSIGEREIALKIDLLSRIGDYLEVNINTDKDFDSIFKLDNEEGWKNLNERLAVAKETI